MFMPQYPIHAATIKADANLPTEYGNFRMRVFVDDEGAEHSLLSVGLEDSKSTPLVRIHSECLTGDAFGSLKCDCGPQLKASMARVQEEGCGAILYMRQEGRGIGLEAKIRAYALQDLGLDTLDANLMLGLPADNRDYKIGASMLEALNIPRVELLSNNPDKAEQLIAYGIDVAARSSLVVGVGDENRSYLETKVERMGHKINPDDLN